MERRNRASVVCVSDNKLLAIELQDPGTRKRFWSVPGGEIESAESAAEAAARETLEETGYRVSVDESSLLTTRYPFRWNARQYDCRTFWFRARLLNEERAPVDDEAYLLGTKWVPLARLDELFSDHPAILDGIRRLLRPPGSY